MQQSVRSRNSYQDAIGSNLGQLTSHKIAAARLAAILLVLLSSSARLRGQEAPDPTRIERPEKIGIGTWPTFGAKRMMQDVTALGAHWYYDWTAHADLNDPRFVPMIWDRSHTIKDPVPLLLAFNEPDDRHQADMPVSTALEQWPDLMAKAARLSSPATTRDGTLGEQSWLSRFMEEADQLGYRVDFVAVHYYATDPDINAFRDFLNAVHTRYGRPIWVTEWALADWERPDRFTQALQQVFFEQAVQMLDDLPFVERHAWFSSYAGLGGYHIRSHLVNADGSLTPLGRQFRAAADGTLRAPRCAGPDPAQAEPQLEPATC